LKNEKIEYQHFELEHMDTKEIITIQIGPMPISAWDFERLTKAAIKKQGKKLTNKWNIKRAWLGPSEEPPETIMCPACFCISPGDSTACINCGADLSDSPTV